MVGKVRQLYPVRAQDWLRGRGAYVSAVLGQCLIRHRAQRQECEGVGGYAVVKGGCWDLQQGEG